ncbi:hypothetical protein [Rufibacter latericius]|uniref:GLPGLI family protein n=1 Tax=Rufibacter latericius TaxID=2487040 RepID=A0A3M9MTZ0_9BACT|nr:hypothetical protein [Rufibacter latericius]RNI28647.1 hypothetical protein EFB08_08385 [Rufibacter latericius]
MRFKSFVFSVFLCFLGLVFTDGIAQVGKTEAQVVQSFMRYLASQTGRHNRVDQKIVPWKVSEVYVNDSLWAKVNLSDDSRIAARQGLYGAGPQLKMDYRLTRQDFLQIKGQIRKQEKTEWTSADFPENIMVLEQLGLAPATYYAYSYPLVLLSKKLVLVKKYYHADKVFNRWSCLEVYRITKTGKYQLENCYQRTQGYTPAG